MHEPDSPDYLETFTNAYIECALWSSIDDNGEPFDDNYDIDDLGPDERDRIREECKAFIAANIGDLEDAGSFPVYNRDDSGPPGCAGHDFWLTRNHHGAGFWDRGLGDIGERLTEMAHAYGECNPYVIDNHIYLK